MALNHSFAGKKVLVTGGGQGIGRQLIERMYKDGAIIYTLERNPQLVQQLQKELPKITALAVDITDWAATSEAIKSFGPMDHLVNNAGVLKSQEFLDITENDIDFHIGVNYKAIINVTQCVVREMIKNGNGGSIVNISSLAGHVTCAGIGAYSSTKSAIIMLTKSMAVEFGKYNIRANSVSPSGVGTELVKLLPETAGTIIGRGVFPRIVEPDEVADAILYLLSPLSSMVTGTDILIDGGVTAC